MGCEYYLFSQIMRKSGGSCQPAGVAARVNLGDRSGDRSGDLKTPTTFDWTDPSNELCRNVDAMCFSIRSLLARSDINLAPWVQFWRQYMSKKDQQPIKNCANELVATQQIIFVAMSVVATLVNATTAAIGDAMT